MFDTCSLSLFLSLLMFITFLNIQTFGTEICLTCFWSNHAHYSFYTPFIVHHVYLIFGLRSWCYLFINNIFISFGKVLTEIRLKSLAHFLLALNQASAGRTGLFYMSLSDTKISPCRYTQLCENKDLRIGAPTTHQSIINWLKVRYKLFSCFNDVSLQVTYGMLNIPFSSISPKKMLYLR